VNYAEIRVRIELIFGLGLPSAAAGFLKQYGCVCVCVCVCVCKFHTVYISMYWKFCSKMQEFFSGLAEV